MTRTRGFGPREALVAVAASIFTLFAGTPAGATGESDPSLVRGVLRIHATAIYADGRREEVTRVFTGSPERAWLSTDAGDWVTVGSRVTNTSSWRSRSKVNYGTTELARENPGKRLMKKGAALVNKNRGTANAPAHKIKNTRHDIIPQNQFPSFGAYISQFHQDRRSTIVMDENDEFIDFVPPALGAFEDADVFGVRYEFAEVRNVAAPADSAATARFVGAFWIEEADIYVRSLRLECAAGLRLPGQQRLRADRLERRCVGLRQPARGDSGCIQQRQQRHVEAAPGARPLLLRQRRARLDGGQLRDDSDPRDGDRHRRQRRLVRG
jgi:hypothetical protein